MKKSTVLRVLQNSPDVVDGPGWTDVEVDGYYNIDGKYIPPQYRTNPTPLTCAHTDTSM